jgi:hypothetical protein
MSGPSAAPPVATPAAPPQPEYDQIVSADVKIKKLCNSDDEYKITFVGNVSKVLFYQSWSSTYPALNNDRKVFEVGAKKWVKTVFLKVENGTVLPRCSNAPTTTPEPVICANGKIYGNSSLAKCAGQKDCKPYIPYTPTCVMELKHDECPIHDKNNEECRHIFVINSAKVNSNGKIVFYVSSKDIDPGNKNKVLKKIKKIPQGEFHNARFDIDNVASCIASCFLNGPVIGALCAVTCYL